MTTRQSPRAEVVAPAAKGRPARRRASGAAATATTAAEHPPVRATPAEEERAVRAGRIAAAVNDAVRRSDAALIDRLFFTLERGRPRKLEAAALMRAFESAADVDGVISALRSGGYAQLASRLAGKREAVARACAAWRNREAGVRSCTRGAGKWVALARLTGFTAESLRTMWKRQLRPTAPGR